MSGRLASTEEGSFFFQPVQLDLEVPDLLIELRFQFLVGFLGLRSPRREDVRECFEQLLLPLRYLVGMHRVGTGNLVDGASAFESFECHLRLELGALLFALCHRCAGSSLG